MNRTWTLEKLQNEAIKYTKRSAFQKGSKTAYNTAQRKNLLDIICKHMEAFNINGDRNPNFKWSLDILKQEALKYNSKSEFKDKNPKAYHAAWYSDVLDEICSHMKNLLHYWTDEELAKEALKHKSRTKFEEKSGSAYLTACRRGLIDEICVHAPKNEKKSYVQKEIFDFINSFYPDTVYDTRKVISPLELDIYIPSLKLAIEYCGLYWHSEEYKENSYHYDKMKFCNEKGIRLITIFEDEWLKRQDQVKNLLKSVINKNEFKIMGRKTKIKEVPKKEAKEFLEQNHIQGSSVFEISFGLYYFNELQAVITGNKHHRQGHSDTLVLNRLAFKTDVSIAGGPSKLFNRLVSYAKERGYKRLISWSDNRWSEGNVYKKLEFELTENLPADYSYFSNQSRISKQSCQKKMLIKKGAKGDMSMTEKELALSLGLYRIYDCGKKQWSINL